MSTENGPETVDLKKAVFDVAHLRTGWAAMAPEAIPEFEWDPSITQAAPRPTTPGEWKRAFECKVFAENALGGVRVWSSNSTGACMGIDALHDQYLAAANDNDGQVPVVEYTGPKHAKIGKGNTSIPQLKIVKWIDRPAELENGAIAASAPPADAQQSLDAFD
jgi:hypothetical protein|tara:strand:- start:280 stop:768 length:489 start_codon:yes stop_codon:yes gene_type:complete